MFYSISAGGRLLPMAEPERREATLDLPDEELRALLARAAELAQRELAATRDGPVFSEPPSAERISRLIGGGELPLEGEPLGELLERCGMLLTAGRRSAPGFFGYVLSPPAPVGVAADLLASAADQNVTSWRSAPAATQVERTVIGWLGRFVGFADSAGGILVSGGSIANLTALLTALAVRTGPGADRRSLTLYASDEAHFSVAKAARALGVRSRRVAIDASHRLDLDALERAIADDRAAGLRPFCLVGTAGTTATGAVDPLDALADAAGRHGLWLHVDGAYGAPAAADPATRPLFAGLARADSLTLDAHKWLYAPLDCGALLVRDPSATAGTFGAGADDYVRVLAEDELEAFAFWEHGLELSRRFRALKLWMTLRHYGARRLAAAIAEDIEVAAHLAERVRADEELELLSGPWLSTCCFRHAPPGLPEPELDRHNERLLAGLQRDGRVYLSNATVRGRLALRACITNFRTTRADAEETLAVVRELGAVVREK
jgi:aromatic-L-amino-acid/L-tryptophan decarboxylase